MDLQIGSWNPQRGKLVSLEVSDIKLLLSAHCPEIKKMTGQEMQEGFATILVVRDQDFLSEVRSNIVGAAIIEFEGAFATVKCIGITDEIAPYDTATLLVRELVKRARQKECKEIDVALSSDQILTLLPVFKEERFIFLEGSLYGEKTL